MVISLLTEVVPRKQTSTRRQTSVGRLFFSNGTEIPHDVPNFPILYSGVNMAPGAGPGLCVRIISLFH